ncbi:MAG: hypothetical protein IH934_06660 [Nanoarchaeota archaeon]|nr:hypothetical protein [Nanoarchaeota archaeon]
MAKDEPYDMMPHMDIIELKKQLQKLKAEKFSSQELMNSMSALTKSMDSMLRLFKEASEELKVEEKEDAINKKLDAVIEQNKIIADGMVTVSDMIKDFIEKQKEPKPVPVPEPAFQQPPLEPSLNEPNLELDQPMPKQGPVVMPSIPFSSLDEPPKPKKKGLFGRLKI